jgi:DNA replication protein DnaC
MPACPVCNGSGYVHPVLPDGKTDYSRVVVCKCVKKDLNRERHTRLQKYSNLGSLTHLTFENINPEGRSGDPENRRLFAAAFNATKKFAEKPEGWLVLIGPAGSGKTHLAAAIVNDRIKNGFPAFFITSADLLDHLRAAFNPSSDMSYDELFEQVRNAPLLVIDDFGSHSGTPWAKEKLDQILNHRFNNLLCTVVTSDIPVNDMDETIRSRFSDTNISRICVIEEKSNLSSEYEWPSEFKLQKSMTFENFDWHRRNLPIEQQEVLEGAFRLAMDFAKSPEGWRVFVGVTGCGKTHLAAAIVNYRYQARQPSLFVVVPEFLDHLRSAFSPDSKLSFDRVFEGVKKAPLLVLDDFGEQFSTPWAKEKLYQVINYRYNGQLPTIITTRLSIDEIMEQIESTVSSRLIDNKLSTVWNITAPDYRTDATSAQKKSPRRTARKWD